MADITPARRYIQTEEVRYRAAVSEAVGLKLGEMHNFIGKRQFDHLTLFLNGPYSIVTPPQYGVDGLFVFPFDAEIINVAIFNLVAGSGGTLELDLKKATSSGGAFSSIFTTTPKVTSAASNNAFGLSYDISDTTDGQSWAAASAPTGITLGVLSSTPYSVSAGNALRLDMIQSMTGGQNAGLIVFHRPR